MLDGSVSFPSGSLALRLRRVWDGDGDCVYRMGAFDCLPAILRLSGNTRACYAGRHGVGSRSGSIVSPPASYPLLFRILCHIAPPRRPVPSHPPRSHACFALIVPLIALMLSPSITRGRPLRFSRPYRLPPITPRLFVSSEQGGFPKRIEFDAFKIRTAERLLSCCLLTVIRVPCHPVGSSHHLIEMCLSPCSTASSHPITV